MRIISGKYRGHKLVAFDAKNIRPTTDRVKEDIFNMVSFVLPEARVLDLFSGTGSLGLESLSRGSQFVTFVDHHLKSIQILKENIAKLKITKEEYEIVKMDVIKFLQKTPINYDVIFIDPPFTEQMADEVMQTLAKAQISDVKLIFIESTKHEKIEDQYGDVITLHKRKSYGDKFLSVFKLKTKEDL